MTSKTLQLWITSLVLFALFSCQDRRTPIGADALIPGADGKSYSVECLRKFGPNGISSCEVSQRDEVEGRAFYGNSYLNYYYWNLLGFNEGDLCQYLFGMQSCYALFGYYNYRPQYSYGSCSPSYLSGYSYESIPQYCYWNRKTGVRLRLQIKAINGSSGAKDQYISLDSQGRVFRHLCPQNSTSSCSREIIAYVANSELRQIDSLIEQARTGKTVQAAPPEMICLAMPNEIRKYSADNNIVFLKQFETPCSGKGVIYNNNPATESLVNKLNGWAGYEVIDPVQPLPIPPHCAMPMCASAPQGCFYQDSPQRDFNGCPIYPCGVLSCN